jgi:DNA adenine methylase
MNCQTNLFGEKQACNTIINVASVPQRSPFRYPGGKTWLVPTVRRWLRNTGKPVTKLIEPFAGGAIVSLTAAFENLADQILLVEKDEEIAAVWETILNGENQWLADKIMTYRLTLDNVRLELNRPDKTIRDVAFCTILKNRVFHGGILAKGSGMIKNGENGKGIASRWYPKTLHDRIIAIGHVKEKMRFVRGDAFEILQQNLHNENACFFIDPPYTIAGKRLYTCSEIDHERLFALASRLKGRFMLTYDHTEEIRKLAGMYGLACKTIPMKTTHHLKKTELIVSNDFSWWI